MRRILFTLILISGVGCMSNPNPGPEKLLADQACSERVQKAYQEVATLNGKFDILIKLKRDEMEKQSETVEIFKKVRETFENTQSMFEKFFLLERRPPRQ